MTPTYLIEFADGAQPKVLADHDRAVAAARRRYPNATVHAGSTRTLVFSDGTACASIVATIAPFGL
jgi:hypothetical protein